MLRLKIIRPFFQWVRALDDANLPFFRFISPKTKRKIVRRFFGRFTKNLPDTITLNGLLLKIPRTLDYSYVLSEHEPGTQKLLNKNLRPGMIAVDIGANVGYLTLLMARLVGPAGKVYAVEPGIENLSFLNANIELNQFHNIEVLPYAAGALRTTARLHLKKASTLHTLYDPKEEGGATVQIEVVPLDEFITESKIDLLKMDIEGGEMDALRGMQRILRATERIIVEWNPVFLQRAGHSPDALPEVLKENGFRLWVIDEKKAQLIEVEKFSHQHQGSHPHANLYGERLENGRLQPSL